jgi:hypothetical protein
MGMEGSIDCPECGLHLSCPSWGCFYVTDDQGTRIALEGNMESTIIAGTLGIDEQAITGCVFAPVRDQDSVRLMEERVGYASFCLCRTCLERCSLDGKRDVFRCPSCGSEDVKTFIQLIGTVCPRCGRGTLEER